MSAATIMAMVAAALAIGAVASAIRLPNPYARRITATMLAAGAILLGAYAYALHSWSATR